MSRSGDTVAELGGEERAFRLGIGQWRKIQEKCDAGPGELMARLAPAVVATAANMKGAEIMMRGLLGTWRIDDVREPILQGLLGANMPANEAFALVKEWVDERPLLESVGVAYKVIEASVIGAEDEKASGEPVAATGASPRSRAARSASGKAASTRRAAPSAGTPGPSTP